MNKRAHCKTAFFDRWLSHQIGGDARTSLAAQSLSFQTSPIGFDGRTTCYQDYRGSQNSNSLGRPLVASGIPGRGPSIGSARAMQSD